MQEMALFLHCTVLYFVCQVFLQILQVVQDFHDLFGSRNSPATDILYTICHVYRMGGPAERLSLALVPCSNVLSMIVKLAN